MIRKTLIGFLGACLASLIPAYGQPFCLDVGDGLDNGNYEEVIDMVASGSNIAFVGIDGQYDQDMRTLVGKINQHGSRLWMRSFNTMDAATYGNYETVTSLIETANGNLVFATNGSRVTFYASITRCSGVNGNLVKARVFPDLQIAEVFELPSGDIVVFGNGTEALQPCVLLLDHELNFKNAITLGLNGFLEDVIRFGSGYVGTSVISSAAGFRIMVFSLTASMGVNWVREFQTGNGSTLAAGLAALSNGSIAVVGFDGNCAPINNGRIVLNRYSAAGALLNTKLITSPGSCLKASDARVNASGNLVIAGLQDNFIGITIGLDAFGAYLGANRLPFWHPQALAMNSTGDMFLGGWHDHFAVPNDEGFVSRLAPNGGSCCSESAEFTVTDVIMANPPGTIYPQTQLSFAPILHGEAADHGVCTYVCGQPTAKTDSHDISADASPTTLSPNPAHDQFQLNLPGDGPSEIQLFDLQGRLLREASLPAGQHSLPVSDLESGVYLLRIQGPGGLSTHKLSIQH